MNAEEDLFVLIFILGFLFLRVVLRVLVAAIDLNRQAREPPYQFCFSEDFWGFLFWVGVGLFRGVLTLRCVVIAVFEGKVKYFYYRLKYRLGLLGPISSVTTSALGRIDLLAPAPLKLVRFPAYSPLPVTALPSMSLFPKSSIRPLGLAHLCRSHPCGSIRPVAKMATNLGEDREPRIARTDTEADVTTNTGHQ